MMIQEKIILLFTLLVIFFTLFVKWFNRTPRRKIVQDQKAIVSPANGKILEIIENSDVVLSFVKEGVLNHVKIPPIMEKPYTAIIIEMNLGHVHAQRSPIEGKLIYREHIPGKFKNAVRSKNNRTLAQENEKTISFFSSKSRFTVGVIQVAGVLARRIQSFGEVGKYYQKGDIFGRILLGSQVILILPQNAHIQSQKGDQVIDGETVIAIRK